MNQMIWELMLIYGCCVKISADKLKLDCDILTILFDSKKIAPKGNVFFSERVIIWRFLFKTQKHTYKEDEWVCSNGIP